MGLSTADANNMLGVRFGGRTSNVPTSYLVGLSSTAPQDDGTGITEPSGGSYARVTIANNTTTWGTPASRIVTNAIRVTFPTPTVAWADLGYWFLLDATTPFRLCAAGRFATSFTAPIGSPVWIEIGALSIRVQASTLQL